MKFSDILITANKNLFRSKLRTTLTILAIFVGGFTLTLTTALDSGANQYLDRQIGNVSVPGVFEVMVKQEENSMTKNGVKEYSESQASLTSTKVTDEDITTLEQVEGVESVTPYYNLNPEYIRLNQDDSKKFVTSSLSQSLGLNLDLSAGRLTDSSDTNTIVLSQEYLQAFGLTAEDAVGQSVVVGYYDSQGQLIEKTFTVVGVMQETLLTSSALYIDLNSAKEIAEAQGQVDAYPIAIVKFKDATDSTDETVLKERILAAGNYSTSSYKESISNVTSVVNAITAGLNVVGFIALAAASFGIINTLLMSVYERTHEIGLMKALGMRRKKVFSLFAVEAALVGFWGSLVAVVVASLSTILINRIASNTFLESFKGFDLLVVTPGGAAFVILLIMAISFIAGTFPAIKASRLNPIEALKSE